jgi:hypothetical protein
MDGRIVQNRGNLMGKLKRSILMDAGNAGERELIS